MSKETMTEDELTTLFYAITSETMTPDAMSVEGFIAAIDVYDTMQQNQPTLNEDELRQVIGDAMGQDTITEARAVYLAVSGYLQSKQTEGVDLRKEFEAMWDYMCDTTDNKPTFEDYVKTKK